MKSLIVIPARYESSRFPGKPLEHIAGKSLIQRVYEQCVNNSALRLSKNVQRARRTCMYHVVCNKLRKYENIKFR